MKMAVPFNEDDEEEQLERLQLLFAQFVRVLTQLLDQLQVPQAQISSSRLASCGDADEEDDDEEEPPSAAAMAVSTGVAASSQLPDVVPRPAPRLSLMNPRPAPRPAPRRTPVVSTKWPSRSPFTKYITSSAAPSVPRVPVAVSRTTCCFNLPDVVRDAVDPAPAAAPMAATQAGPSPAPRRPSGPAPASGPARCHPPEAAPAASKRRPGRKAGAQFLAAELAAAVSKCAAPAPSAAPTLRRRQQWLQQREDDLEKAMKATPGVGAVASRNDEWVGIGNNLRELADVFDKTLTTVDAVDGPASPPRTSLLRMLLLPLVSKSSLESKFITTAIMLYCGYSYFRR